jgi:hypothetical protein
LAFDNTRNSLAVLDGLGVGVFDLDKKDALPLRLADRALGFRPRGRVTFSPDGRYIVALKPLAGYYVLWLWDADDLVEDACSSFVHGELSPTDWEEYIKVLPRAPACLQVR